MTSVPDIPACSQSGRRDTGRREAAPKPRAGSRGAEKTNVLAAGWLGALLLAVFVSAMLDPRPSRSGAAAGRAHSDDGCDHLSYARARPHTIGSSLFGEPTPQGADLVDDGQETPPEVKAFVARMMRPP